MKTFTRYKRIHHPFGNILFLMILLLSIGLMYFQVSRLVKHNIDEELNQITNISLGAVKSAVDLSIQNYLRSGVEMNKEIVSHFYSAYKKGQLSEKEAKERAARILLSQTIGDTGYFYVIDSQGKVLIHPAPITGNNLVNDFPFVKKQTIIKKGYLEYMWANPGEAEKRPKALYMDWFEPWDWIISASTYRDEFSKLVNPEDLRTEISDITIGETGYVVLIDVGGKALIHPQLETGTNMLNIKDEEGRYIIQEIVEQKEGNIRYMWRDPGKENVREKFAYFGHYPELGWIIIATSYSSELEAAKNRIIVFSLLQLFVVIFLIVNFRRKKKAEKSLRETNEKLNALFSSMTEIVVLHELVLDRQKKPVNYRITDCNDSFTRITGISKKEALGKPATEVFQTEEPPYLEKYARVAITGEAYHFETFYTPLGKHFSISAVSPGKNKFATIATDITDLRKFQHTIEEKNKELEQIVYVASHDLRSPLVNVEGYSQELEYALKELFGKFNDPAWTRDDILQKINILIPDIEEAISHIKISTHEMDTLLKGLLLLSRLGRASLDIKPVDMNLLMERVLLGFEYQIKEMGAQVNLQALPSCNGDIVQVKQVFSNLISNALKYHHPNRPLRITISGTIEMNRSVYCVEDNGMGIAPEHQDKIFELFHRLNPLMNEGEGLGLTIVRQIIQRLDGKIRVESEPGKGSRFFVNIPFAKSEEDIPQ